MSNAIELSQMVERLAAMPSHDREFVLGHLDSNATRKLLPLLEQPDRYEMTPVLKGLVQQAEQGLTPDGMTLRGASALAQAMQASRREERNASRAQSAISRPAIWTQIARFLGLEG